MNAWLNLDGYKDLVEQAWEVEITETLTYVFNQKLRLVKANTKYGYGVKSHSWTNWRRLTLSWGTW